MHSFNYMYRLLLLLFAFTCSFLPGGQCQLNAKIDSLQNLLAFMPEDSSKVDVLVEISRLYLGRSELDQSEKYLEQLKILSTNLQHQEGLAHYYCNSGLVAYNRGKFADALSRLNTALLMCEKRKDQKGIADNLTNIGLVYDQQADYTKAIEYYSRALSLRADSDTRGKSAGYNNLGVTYFMLGNYPEALANYLKSLEMDELTGNKKDIAYSNNNLGTFYKYQNDTEKALQYFQVANRICKEIGDWECIAGTNLNIGSLYQVGGEYLEALEYYEGSLGIFREKGLTQEVASTESAIGSIYMSLGDYDAALRSQQSALATSTEINYPAGVGFALQRLGELYMRRGDYENAEISFSKALELYQRSGDKLNMRNIYSKISQLDSLQGDFLSSLMYYKQYITYKDSLVNESSLKAIAQIQTQYDTEKKDKEILQLESEKQIHQLQISLHEKTLRQQQAEENRLRVENLLHLHKAQLMDKEKALHLLTIENSKAQDISQQAELKSQEAELTLMNNAYGIQQLEIRKQRAAKNYLLIGLVLSALLAFFAYRYYATRQKLKLQTLRNKIASDLHDDVGSTLSSISIFSELAQQQSKEVIPLLNTIRESSHKMLDAMGDIVWTINPENDQFEKILIRMRNFAFDLLGARKIDFEFIADEKVAHIQLPMEARKNLYLIFKEAANNMVKYSDADKAFFLIKEDMGYLTLSIRDNGKGFDTKLEAPGNGIKSMKKRAEEIGAKMNIESVPGAGTLIELKMAV